MTDEGVADPGRDPGAGPDTGLDVAPSDAGPGVDAGPCGGCPEGFECVDGGCLAEGEVLVGAGPFFMGCNDLIDLDCDLTGEEAPRHQVEVPAFLIDLREVTVAEYALCVAAAACGDTDAGPGCNAAAGDRPDHPINCVDHVHAQQYCAFAGKRLCSEAEWEKAARGGCDVTAAPCQENMRIWPWGNAVASCVRAVMTSGGGEPGCGELATAPVGSKPEGKGPYGLDDMAGNVAEWVADCWHSSYDGAPADGSAWTEGAACDSGILRGGGYEHPASIVRTSARLPLPLGPDFTSNSAGIRCCRDPLTP